jgi:subtilisin family serine protease
MKSSLTFLSSAIALALSSTVSASGNAPDFGANADLSNVQNRCIVTLRDDVSNVRGLANAMSARANASLKHVYQHSIKGFTINMPCSAAAHAFGGDANIAGLEQDSVMFASMGKPGGGGGGNDPAQDNNLYGVARVGGSSDGTGMTAWVIDSGVDLDHNDLNVDTVRAANFVSGKDTGGDDLNGHGTHVAGTIGAIDNAIGVVGVAANATIVPVRVLDRSGSGSTSGVIAGIDYVAANASPGDCANMSLGGGVSAALDNAVIAAASSSGAFFALAAGNDGDDADNHSPARAEGNGIFTISAIDANDNMPSWSNFGSHVDFAAPGVGIKSTWKSGGYNTISGTSMAAPHACAVLMLTGGNPRTSGSANNDPDNNPDPIISQ